MNFESVISPLLGISEKQVAATIALLDEKATIPFIARYRKEKTGSLDEVQIADIQRDTSAYRNSPTASKPYSTPSAAWAN